MMTLYPPVPVVRQQKTQQNWHHCHNNNYYNKNKMNLNNNTIITIIKKKRHVKKVSICDLMLGEWAGNNTHWVIFFEHIIFQLWNSAHVDTTDAARDAASVWWSAQYVYYSRLYSPRDGEHHTLLSGRVDPQEITCLHILCTYLTWSSLSDILFKLQKKTNEKKRENALCC